MKQTVYVDILIVLNVFVNYFLLLETAFVGAEKYKKMRLLAASVLGGIYSLIILLPPMNVFLSAFIKLIFSATIVLAAFKTVNIRHFLRLFATFFAVNFVFAGLMLAVWIVLKPNGMQFNNGAIYLEIDALTLTLLTVFCYVVVSFVSKLARKKSAQDKRAKITVCFDGREVRGNALIDTGNALKDSFSGAPVIVCEYSFIKDVLPNELGEFFSNQALCTADGIADDYKGQIRLIPFDSIGGAGVLKAFHPDSLLIRYGREKIKTDFVYIAVKNTVLSNGEYCAIINPDMIDAIHKEAAK